MKTSIYACMSGTANPYTYWVYVVTSDSHTGQATWSGNPITEEQYYTLMAGKSPQYTGTHYQTLIV